MKININKKFQLFDDHWNPKIVAELNGQAVKLAKVQGEFVWHSHENEDEMFYVIKGLLTINFRDKSVEVGEGEMIVIPKGVEHKPVAKEEVWMMIFEPSEIKHTGDVQSDLTVQKFDWI